jgi:hypothetical protein
MSRIYSLIIFSLVALSLSFNACSYEELEDVTRTSAGVDSAEDSSLPLGFWAEGKVLSRKVDTSISLPAAKGLGATYKVTRVNVEGRLPEKPLSDELRVVFQNVDKATFEKLLQYYSGWSKLPSQVSFDTLAKGKAIIDEVPIQVFLPPLMQALINKGFDVQLFSADKPDKTDAATNCWSTAYEIVRLAETGSSDYTLFFANHVKELLENDSYSQHISLPKKTANQLAKMSAKARNQLLKSGDTLSFYIDVKIPGVPLLLSHVVVFLDGDLFFEKPSYDSDRPFRLISMKDLAAKETSEIVSARRWTNPQPQTVLPDVLDYYQGNFKELVKTTSDNHIYFDNTEGKHIADIIYHNDRPLFYTLTFGEDGMGKLVDKP